MRSLIVALVLGIGLLGLTPAASAAERIEVLDLADELSDADEQFLRDRTPGIDLPPEVTAVTYVLFPVNDDNLNDTVRSFGENERRDLISEAGDKWAPGALIVAVGRDPQRMGVYCGDDVCDAADIYADGRIDGILDRMRPPLRDGNLAAGMLEGTKAVADPTAVRESSDAPAWLGWAVGGGGVAFGLGLVGAAAAASRRRQVATAREQFDVVQRDYGRVAGELQAIDVRAHSLTSPLANDALRRQWEEVKTGFLGLNDTFDRLAGLTADSPDKEFRERRASIATAHEQVTRLRTAEENIEQLARMEHGDADVRRRGLTELHEDNLRAITDIDDVDLKNRLELLDARVLDLRARLDAPQFMDEFADLVTDHRVLVEAAQEKLYEESGTAEVSDDGRRAPALWDAGWRPGNYVPYAMVYSWHSADVAAAQSAGSSATTGYSSGGFSGGGGSSSY
ncbi:MAG TPA: DUF5129 domain-containing protein [Corynebacterium pollutisoli]|nr:DUF5129 domain-containing protein [Corynebacterium pollutisoli]